VTGKTSKRKKGAGQEIIGDEREEQADWKQMKQKFNIALQLGSGPRFTVRPMHSPCTCVTASAERNAIMKFH
jgi:hypothetical protein